MVKVSEWIYELKGADPKKYNELRLNIEQQTKKIEDYYNRMEAYAQQIPDKMPMLDALIRMRTVFQEDQGEVSFQRLLDEMIDSQNWNEASQQFFLYAAEMSRTTLRRKQSLLDQKPLHFSDWEVANSPHTAFAQAFMQFQKELSLRKLGIWPTFLEKSAFGCIIEVKFGVIHERLPVVQQKILLVENHGNIEMIIFVAPHEEWVYHDDWMGKKIDLSQQSRYIVYQKITAGAAHSLHMFGPDQKWSAQLIMHMFTFFSRYKEIMEHQCRICKKVMKDYLPCTTFDKGFPIHDSCR